MKWNGICLRFLSTNDSLVANLILYLLIERMVKSKKMKLKMWIKVDAVSALR